MARRAPPSHRIVDVAGKVSATLTIGMAAIVILPGFDHAARAAQEFASKRENWSWSAVEIFATVYLGIFFSLVVGGLVACVIHVRCAGRPEDSSEPSNERDQKIRRF